MKKLHVKIGLSKKAEREFERLEKLKDIQSKCLHAAENGQISLSDTIRIMMADKKSEIKKILKKYK